jgi:NIMA (never in mitosis gene a)-related kinase
MNNYNSNTTLRDFEIMQEIGKGAFGSVFKVRRIKDGELYALKKVPMGKLKMKEKENSLNEIRILASINHPNVISYKEAFYDNNTYTLCIVMEFAECGDLDRKITNHIKNKSHMAETEIFSYLVQIIQGLKALHDKKILHRDIKAANIFIFKNNLIKIGDLNVSKVMKMGMLYTQTGTPYYASPEVWNDKPYDYKSDLWSLGCLLYEMTTLKAPFRGTTMKAVYDKVMKGYYDPVPSFYSKTLSGIISSMLQINPINRPTCEQILNIISEKMKHLKLVELNPKTISSSSILTTNLNKTDNDIETSSKIDINMNVNVNLNKSSNSNFTLLKTIKIPKRMIQLNMMMPGSRYEKKRINK